MRSLLRFWRPFAVVTVVASLAACMANPARPFAGAPSLEDLRNAFQETGRALIDHLRTLMVRAPRTDALDFQTAITLESIRLSPRHVADRGIFYQEAERLDRLLVDVPDTEVPRDSAVLAYLAHLTTGAREVRHHLTPWEEDRVLKLCGPAQITPGSTPDSGDPDEILRQACFKWLLGDAPKSRALYYYMQAPNIARAERVPESAFEAFILRLREETGVDLLAHRGRLAGTTSESVAYAPGGSGQMVSQKGPNP